MRSCTFLFVNNGDSWNVQGAKICPLCSINIIIYQIVVNESSGNSREAENTFQVIFERPHLYRDSIHFCRASNMAAARYYLMAQSTISNT